MDENVEIKNEIVKTEESNYLTIPALTCKGKTLFPNVLTNIEVGRIKSMNAVNAALSSKVKLVFVSLQKNNNELVGPSDFSEYGVVCKIGTLSKTPANIFQIAIECIYRAKLITATEESDYILATVEKIETYFDPAKENEIAAQFRLAKDKFTNNFSTYFKTNRAAFNSVCGITNPDEFINASTFNLPFKEEEKQKLLAIIDMYDRLELYNELLCNELEIANIQKRIEENVRQSVEKNQKEYYLREQLRAIHEELGDNEKENDKIKNDLENKGLSKESLEKVLKEFARMTRLTPMAPDYSVLRTYLDWILDLPFKEESKDTELLADCSKILEEDHFGLEKVKKRIVEYLAVLKLTKSLRGPIICLVGPPGVGKTSIAKSVARALGRKLVRMSLGGVKDEAEIRGHRKTYIGAMPGRIIYGMKEAGTINPVFLLDEIDKISSDMRGDPASALLEVLDPEQNPTFRDRYLEIPYDLSKVMFITTANSLDTIPAPLLDRMEVIELSGYTEEEKVQIAKRYLIPKQLEMNGLKKKDISINEDGIKFIIEGYTGEAGVRKLEQTIGSVCRGVATIKADNPDMEKQVLDKETIPNFIGAPRYIKDDKVEEDGVGSATGLAWTAIGGTTLTIEVATMKGKGGLMLTGKLGDVMQESAKTAISFIRSKASEYGISDDVFENTDIHLHVPEGATPKDGPSAGITIACAILSALTGKKARRNIAMTGEITLRGNVLPIGGLKEKALAAYRLGIKKIIIPKANTKDLEEIPKEIASKITFVPVEKIDQVFDEVIVK